MIPRGLVATAALALAASAPASAAGPRLTGFEYRPAGDRATLVVTGHDRDGQVVGVTLTGDAVLTADGACGLDGRRNGQPTRFLLPFRRLDPGHYRFGVRLDSSSCTDEPTIEDTTAQAFLIVSSTGRAHSYVDPPPPCRAGDGRAVPRVPGQEAASVEAIPPVLVLGCLRPHPSRRRIEVVGYRISSVRSGESSACAEIRHRGASVLDRCGLAGDLGRRHLAVGPPIPADDRVTITGTTSGRVARVRALFTLRGRHLSRPAALARIRRRSLLRPLGIAAPFGRFVAEVPRGALDVRLRAYAASGRPLGTGRP